VISFLLVLPGSFCLPDCIEYLCCCMDKGGSGNKSNDNSNNHGYGRYYFY
jgi:hypothetical protein